MKRILILISIIIVAEIHCSAQTTGRFLTPFNDALDLKQYVNNKGKIEIDADNKEKIFSILIKYMSIKDSASATYIKNDFDPNAINKPDPNPFINIELAKLHAGSDQKFIGSTQPGTKSDQNKSALGFSLSNLGSSDVSSVVDALAKFIVKRTKQELSIAFFERFQDDLNNYPDLQSAFPQTFKTLSVIGNGIYRYEAYLQTLKKSFEKDLASLPSNLPCIINNHEDYFNTVPELKAELLTAFYIIQVAREKQHPGKIIENYPINYLNAVNPNVKAAFQTLQLFSTSLKSNNDNTYWVSDTDVKKLVNDTTSFKLYLGLVLQIAKNDTIVFGSNRGIKTNLADVMIKYYKKYYDYQPYIITFATKTRAIETKFMDLVKLKTDSILLENYYGVITNTIDLMKYGVQIDKLSFLKNDTLKIAEKTHKYFDFAQTATEIVKDVNRKNYSSAIVNDAYLIKESFDTTNVKTFTEKESGKLSKKEKEKINTGYFTISDKLLKYGTFMATVIDAESSDDIETAIETIALPTGSARIKRESDFNVSLNAYCGLFVGQDRTKLWSQPEYSYGVTAPIGIAASWGRKHSSFSAFVSIIDLGAVTSFRFKNDTATISKITLRDIVSPGLFFSYGIPKSPISINAGYQLAPLLNSVSTSGNSSNARTFRFTLGICVDIPVLNFYTKPK